MSDSREFEGGTLNEALEAASQRLGIPPDEIDFDLLDEGRKGVFGLGQRQVRIRIVSSQMPAEAPPKRRPRRPERRAGREERARPRREKSTPAPAHRKLQETVQRMLKLMKLELDVEVEGAGDSARVQLNGPDKKLLLQKDAQLLSSLQFLLNRMARRAWPEIGRVQLQCDGYRSRKDEELVELVREVASQVQRTGQPKQLHPMNPYERRLTHLTVREIGGLASRSAGGGFLKRVTVTRDEG